MINLHWIIKQSSNYGKLYVLLKYINNLLRLSGFDPLIIAGFLFSTLKRYRFIPRTVLSIAVINHHGGKQDFCKG